MPQQFYSDEDAEAILKLASRKSGGGDMSRDRLFETAAELGITPEAVEEAELNFRREQRDLDDLAAYRKHKKAELAGHLGSFVATCGGLVALDLFTSHGHLEWSYWVVLFWAIGVVQNIREVYFPSAQDREKSLRRWQRKQERRAAIADGSRNLDFGVSGAGSFSGIRVNVNTGGGQEIPNRYGGPERR